MNYMYKIFQMICAKNSCNLSYPKCWNYTTVSSIQPYKKYMYVRINCKFDIQTKIYACNITHKIDFFKLNDIEFSLVNEGKYRWLAWPRDLIPGLTKTVVEKAGILRCGFVRDNQSYLLYTANCFWIKEDYYLFIILYIKYKIKDRFFFTKVVSQQHVVLYIRGVFEK